MRLIQGERSCRLALLLATEPPMEKEEEVETMRQLIQEMVDLDVGPVAGAGGGNGSDDRVEEARGHLECPICLEMMRPPTRIWQCPQSHLVCETCRDRLENHICPT